jgi:hypothetical protein
VTDSAQLFQVDDRTVIIWNLPSEFSAQSRTARVTGEAIICRVDHESGGVTLEFVNHVRTLERIDGQSCARHFNVRRCQTLPKAIPVDPPRKPYSLNNFLPLKPLLEVMPEIEKVVNHRLTQLKNSP